MGFYSRRKRVLIWGIIGIICVFVLVGNVYEAKLKSGMTDAFYNISSFFTEKIKNFETKESLYKEADRLREENAKLKLERERLFLLEKENERLSELLKTKKMYREYETEAALVIGRHEDLFIIEKGEKDGISVDMPVVSEGGLLGRIIEVSENFSKVQSILEPSSSVSAQSCKTGDTGILKGDVFSEGICVMEYIYSGADIKVGDEISVSALSENFPPGLKIGSVTEIIPDENEITLMAKVTPYADIYRCDRVLVITKSEEDK